MGWKLITKIIEFSVAHYHDVTGLISQSGGRRPTADGKVANQEAGAPVQTPTRFSAYSPSGAAVMVAEMVAAAAIVPQFDLDFRIDKVV